MGNYNTAVPPVEWGNCFMTYRYFSINQLPFQFFRFVVLSSSKKTHHIIGCQFDYSIASIGPNGWNVTKLFWTPKSHYAFGFYTKHPEIGLATVNDCLQVYPSTFAVCISCLDVSGAVKSTPPRLFLAYNTATDDPLNPSEKCLSFYV